MNTLIVNGELFAKMVKGGANNLKANRQIVNDLNVFPIPDGDTGDNMFMTIDMGASEIDPKDDALCSVATKAANGMLHGAHGNSGVILSRIFHGIAVGLADNNDVDIASFGAALENGVLESYCAVKVPVEGTILTVYKDAVRYANARINSDTTLETYLDDLLCELKQSLERTPELLKVLKDAGVVDSGGAGLQYIVEGMKAVVEGKEVFITTDDAPTQKRMNLDLFGPDSTLEFGYCTEFLLRLQTSKVGDIDAFTTTEIDAFLEEKGNSVVCFKDGSIVKVHVHTMNPGEILNFFQKFGEFLTLKIENMLLQHNETVEEGRGHNTGDATVKSKKRRHKKYGIISVAAGEGIKNVFTELGTDIVIDGGQSMNPAVDDFVRAFDEINSDNIFVFPNNSNIILTAEQAASLAEDKVIKVLPSKSIGEGYAAISMFDTSSDDVDAIYEEAKANMATVQTGMVSKANRDANKDGVDIKSGDYIGFAGSQILCSLANRKDAVLALADKLGVGKRDIVMLVKGQEADQAECDEIYKELTNKYKRTETIVIDGGQPVYDYALILE